MTRLRAAAWIAAFAVVLQTLWPLLSHARPKSLSALVPVCTIEGVTHYLDLKPGTAPLEERTFPQGDHCKLCAFGADRGAALPAERATPLAAVDPVGAQANTPPDAYPKGLNLPPVQPRGPPEPP